MFTIDNLIEYLEYLEDTNYMDDYIYSMDDFNELHYGVEPCEICRRMHFGDFNPCDDYWKYNGYGNLESLDEWEVEKIMNDDADFEEWYAENYGDEEDE